MPANVATRIAAAGTVLALTVLALFSGLHMLIVTPNWAQLAMTIPFVVAIGIAVTWAYHEFVRAQPRAATRLGGVRFGAILWLASLPAIALASTMRVTLGGPLPFSTTLVAIGLALAGGGALVGAVTRDRRATIAAAVASLTLFGAGGGQLPILRSGRVVELWVGLLLLEAVGGAIVSWLHARWVAPTPAAAA